MHGSFLLQVDKRISSVALASAYLQIDRPGLVIVEENHGQPIIG